MRRRDFIAGIAGSAAAWPLAARAQQPGTDAADRSADGWSGRCNSRRTSPSRGAAGRTSEARVGEGRNIQIDTRWRHLRRGGEAAIREGTRRAPARADSFARHARHGGAAATDAQHPDRIRGKWAIQSAAASAPASRGRAATSLVSSISSRRWPASGWSCSRRSRRASNVVSAHLYEPGNGARCRHRLPANSVDAVDAASQHAWTSVSPFAPCAAPGPRCERRSLTPHVRRRAERQA